MKTFIGQYDLRHPVQHLWGITGYQHAFILVRDGGRPLDVLYLPVRPNQVALSRQELEQELEHRLGIAPAFVPALPQTLDRENGLRMPPISVVVCTRDRAPSLARCLASLNALDYERFEVIVVDNASRDRSTAEVVAKTPFGYVREERPGLDWARNRGAAEARHDIIAYTDDDVRVDPQWLRGVAHAFASPQTTAMTGLVLPGELETRAQHLFQVYSRGMSKGTKAKQFNGAAMSARDRITTHFLGVGANMAFRRSALLRLGGFDTALDVGTPSAGGGDLDMFHRVLMAGGAIRYEPRALVWHYDRRTMEGLRQQLYNNGRAFGVYLVKCWRTGQVGRRHVADYAFGIWGRWLVGRVVLKLLCRHRLPLRLLWAELWGALHAPSAYVATYRHDRQLRQTCAELTPFAPATSARRQDPVAP